MNFTPTAAQVALHQHFSGFAQEHLNSDIALRVNAGTFERELWDLCGQERIQGLAISTAYGGRGLSALDMAFALEGLGYGCEDGGLLFAMAAQLFACNIPIALYGSVAQKEELLPRLCSGELIITNAMTEAAGGSAAFQMLSQATPDATGYQLTGTKTYCANAPVADLCLAYVLTDRDKGFFGGVSPFLLDRQQHAYSVTSEVDKPGLRTCRTGGVCLDGVTASANDILGKAGGGAVIFNRSMDWERVGMSALNTGTMARLLERAVEFSRTRKPGGVAISEHQSITHSLADLRVGLEACKLLVYQAASRLDQARGDSTGASMCKLFVSEHFKSMCVRLVQLYASEGYQSDSEIARCLQESMASTLYSGTSEIQRNIIARWMRL